MENTQPETIKNDALLAGLGFLSIFIFMFITDPQALSAPLLLILPLLVIVSFFYSIRLILKLFTEAGPRRIKGLSLVLALGPTLLVVFGSLGQLGLQDIALSLLLVAGSAWYLKRYQASRESVL